MISAALLGTVAAGRRTAAVADLIVGTSGITNINSATPSISVPAGAASGDTMLVVLRCRGDRTFTVPGGWTTLADRIVPVSQAPATGNTHTYILTKAWSSETSVTFTQSTAAGCGVLMVLVRGTIGNNTLADGTSASITKANANSNLLAIAINNGTTVEPGAATNFFSSFARLVATSFLSAGSYFFAAQAERKVSAAAGSVSVSNTWAGSGFPDNYATFLAELNP